MPVRVSPANGGGTEFVSTRLAFEKFPAALQQRLENSFAWHNYAHSKAKIAKDLASQAERDAFPQVCWRMVWRNPVNQRGALYLASHACGVEGMAEQAGLAFIDELTEMATQPGTTYEHNWTKGDVVMWDNRATMHRGRPYDDASHRRELRRVTTLDIDTPAAA